MKVVDSLRRGERSIGGGENWKPTVSIKVSTKNANLMRKSILSLRKKEKEPGQSRDIAIKTADNNSQ